ncbi:uncharacterized protein LOC104894846 [Beta vulgaris subsp. vulgaris]|uniref:uncharacterized protein LOC104894846 n=1 Tax=Beta vulgaris subsp. vulgaris TaxID=3555 RepID=UPI0020375D2D|nr:uncharacterized protein LOC104894846 [Beta vulgaris subsp. vulgaris]
MRNVVHIDEKWFYMTRKRVRAYLHPREKTPWRKIKNKNFIPKAMFIAAVARPRWNQDGSCAFNGKIGIWAFTKQVPAQRRSNNRPRGTLETKPIEAITKDVIRDMLVHKIMPAIREKWPDDLSKVIYIQQDNAPAHITNDDPIFQQHRLLDGFDFRLIQQPPNSPDMNCLDLGYFRSLQTLQYKKSPRTIDQLVTAVNESWEELHPKTLSNVWMSLQFYLNEVIKVCGSNEYDEPHAKKKQLEDLGLLPEEVGPSIEDVQKAIQFVDDHLNGN